MTSVFRSFHVVVQNFYQRFWTVSLLVPVLLLAGQRVHAKCATPLISFWPAGGEIPRNPILMVEGYDRDREFIRSLGSLRNVALRSGKHTVCLDVHARHESQTGLTQVLLSVDAMLDPAQGYRLWIENYAQVGRTRNLYVESIPRPALPSFKVNASRNQRRPAWIKRPEIIKKVRLGNQCPALNYVLFQGKVLCKTDYLILAHMRPKGKNKRWTAYLVPDSNQVFMVGDATCEGAFSLWNHPEYEVKFDLLDIAGNVAPWRGKPILFAPALPGLL
jgi:hypothetical protein